MRLPDRHLHPVAGSTVPEGANAPGRDDDSLQPSGRFGLGLFAQVALGALMVGIGIGSEPFWFDELASISVAERSVGGIFDVLGNTDANMGFYYLLLHLWLWGGDSETWVRALSALPAVATIPTTAILARRLFDERVGLVSGFMLAGSLFFVANAQNARAYALALFLITLATLFFVEAVRSGRRLHLIAYGTASVLAVYASPLSGLVLVGHALSLPFLPQVRTVRRRFALVYTSVLLAVAPLAAGMLLVGDDQVSSLRRPGLNAAFKAVREILGMGYLPVAIAFGSLVVVGLVACWRHGWSGPLPREDGSRWRASLLFGWAFIPPVLLFTFSQVSPLFLARYLLTSAPALAILAALGLVTIAGRSRAIAGATGVILCCLVVLGRADLKSYGDAYRPGWGDADWSAAQMIASRGRAEDGILYEPDWQRLSVETILEREAAGRPLPADFAVEAGAEEAGDLYAREVSPEVRNDRLRHYRRVWVLRWNSAFREPTQVTSQPILDSEYRLALKRDLGVLRVALYTRRYR